MTNSFINQYTCTKLSFHARSIAVSNYSVLINFNNSCSKCKIQREGNCNKTSFDVFTTWFNIITGNNYSAAMQGFDRKLVPYTHDCSVHPVSFTRVPLPVHIRIRRLPMLILRLVVIMLIGYIAVDRLASCAVSF